MITLTHLQMNQILALDNPHRVDIPLNQTKQNTIVWKETWKTSVFIRLPELAAMSFSHELHRTFSQV